jgi:hypothetical protein
MSTCVHKVFASSAHSVLQFVVTRRGARYRGDIKGTRSWVRGGTPVMEFDQSTQEIHVVVFCVVTPCSDVQGRHHFEVPCCLHLQGEVNEGGVPRSSEKSVSYHITTRCHNPEDHDLNLYRHENLKSRQGRWILLFTKLLNDAFQTQRLQSNEQHEKMIRNSEWSYPMPRYCSSTRLERMKKTQKPVMNTGTGYLLNTSYHCSNLLDVFSYKRVTTFLYFNFNAMMSKLAWMLEIGLTITSLQNPVEIWILK